MGQQAILPFSPGYYWDDMPTGTLLGSEYLYKDGRRFKLVENANGAVIAGRRTLEWDTRSTNKVQYANGRYANVCGVSPDELAVDGVTVPDGDFFLMQVEGDAELTRGVAGGDVVAGEYVANAADTDQGKCEGITLRRDVQHVDPGNMKTEAGLTLTAATDITIAQTGGKQLSLTWDATANEFVSAGTFTVPKDFDVDADDISLIVLCTKAGTTDNRTLDSEMYVQAANGAFGADLNIAAVALGAPLITDPKEIEIDMTGKSLVPGDRVKVQLALTQPGSTDAGTIEGCFLRYKSREVPGHAFAIGIDAAAADDTVFTARLLPQQIVNA